MYTIPKKVVGTFAIIAIGFSVLVPCQRGMDELKAAHIEEELLYLPNHKLLNYSTAGLSNIVADLLWIKTIQYAVKEFKSKERKFTWLAHMNETVVRLDPYFEGAFTYGGMLMAAAGEDDKALQFLKRGMAQNPDSWQIPYEIAKVYMHNRKTRPESAAMVAHYLTMVGERHDYPAMYIEWARSIQDDNNFDAEAREIWEDMLVNADDDFVRELARANLLDIAIEENIEKLQAATDTYVSDNGRIPSELANLVETGYIDQLPQNPQQGTYFIDPDGAVMNTVLLERVTTRILKRVNAKIKIFRDINGRYPKSIAEWDAFDTETLPEHPWPGHKWAYNPQTGTVSSVKL